MSRVIATGLTALLIALVAYTFQSWRHGEHGKRDDRVAVITEALSNIERMFQISPNIRVAVGLEAWLDMFVDSSEFLTKYGLQPPDEPASLDVLDSQKDLLKVFAHYFQMGASSGRYMTNRSQFWTLVNMSSVLPNSKWKIGGNAVLMANRLVKEGCDVMLGASMTNGLKTQINDKVRVVGQNLSDSVDECHLLFEYKSGQQWGHYSAPRANRFRVHSNRDERIFYSLEKFRKELPRFRPHLLIIAGLGMVDSIPVSATKTARMKALQTMLTTVSNETRVHFEMSSYAERSMLDFVIDSILPYTDSLGMNEQELAKLYTVLQHGNTTSVSESRPGLPTVLDQMRTVYQLLRRKSEAVSSGRALTRIHTHTLAFQVILTDRNSTWKNTMTAAAKASLTSYRHVCQSDHINTTKAMILMDDVYSTSHNQEWSRKMRLKPDSPVSCWEEYGYEICVSPVLVCTEVVRTAGGGDNVSSAAIAVQI